MKNIVFVCSGNTCRSPMAEGLFRKYIEDNKIEGMSVSSCGTSAMTGDPASINSVLALQKRGIDISNHRARVINPEILLNGDLFVCMSETHAKVLARYCDESQLAVLGVNDPFMQSLEVYERCCDLIEEQIPGIAKKAGELPVVRKMGEKDIEAVASLEKECFSVPWSENSLREELSNPTARFYTLKNGGELYGYIGANNICGEVYITNVAVSEKHRRRGFGKRLLKSLILQSRFENAAFVTLEVRRSNSAAVSLYEGCGFKQTGERKDFYTSPKEDALIYTFYPRER